jgi:signal transduction histidine kinase
VDLREVSREVAEAIRVAMPAAPRLQVSGEAWALGSPARFRQVIFNLVKNAAEAAGPAGEVDVEVGYDRDAARVLVSDTGPGVPPTVRDRVFEPFYTTKTTGTGLGLALARAIAQAHGGDVELEPASAGARFSLRAPRAREGAST